MTTSPHRFEITFECPVCKRATISFGTPEECIVRAKAAGWHEVRSEVMGPIPLLVCSADCWQRYWLLSSDALMKMAVERMCIQRAGYVDVATGTFVLKPEKPS